MSLVESRNYRHISTNGNTIFRNLQIWFLPKQTKLINVKPSPRNPNIINSNQIRPINSITTIFKKDDFENLRERGRGQLVKLIERENAEEKEEYSRPRNRKESIERKKREKK